MSKKDITSGRNANQNGKYVEGCVHDFLDKVCEYEYIPPNKFLVTSNSLNQKIFTRQLAICDSIYSIKESKNQRIKESKNQRIKESKNQSRFCII